MKTMWSCLFSLCVLAAAALPLRANEIDRLVSAKLNAEGRTPAARCSDAVFVRRIYLDMTGRLPPLWVARQFTENKRANKRVALINQLFKQDAFADYWAMKWCDILRVKAEFPSKLWPNAVQAYQRWLTDAVHDNMPYDQFARELLTASGSNFREPAVNFFRAVPDHEPASLASTVALTFMGQRTDNWPRARRDGMAAFFARLGYKGTAEWKEEVVFFDLPRALKEGMPAGAVFPDGTPQELLPEVDPRLVFAEWLVAPDNPYFARAMVNRVWAWLIGRGLVHEADDLRADNPPSHPPLLDWLAKELVAHDYDLRHVYRLILNSDTYQRSCVHSAANADDARGFSHYLVRRLEAEVLIDAINQVAGGSERYTSEIPEPFTFIPPQQRAVALGDGSITSPFLDMFGRPPRDTGLESERNNDPSDTQRLHLLNSTHIQNKLQRGWALRQLMKRAKWRPEPIINQLYLTMLSRPPNAGELKVGMDYMAQEGLKRHEGALDLAWALLNSKEFLYRH
ncbi:MAG: DUF1553 domain-containing protein [Verrucomicrobia bacterium]|nr:DUF1553 domain-containing protein [Verrucomicrobiota bacterium]MBT7065384.1 DUF1553 domain-containing protein [Verrucomicrobiota bacterium]MBT7699204.1 DUF1553 domain-containing protein [Verrucomicrobiota bacterium]